MSDDLVDEYAGGLPTGRRRRLLVLAGVVLLAALGVGLGLGLSDSSGPPAGPEGVALQNVPDLASADSTVAGTPVGDVTCRKKMDQGISSYHIHVHLDIFVNGQQKRVPAGAGIDQPRQVFEQPGGQFVDQTGASCLYWLHVHANDGIIHVEAPHKATFTLGQFFDVWGQPLGLNRVGPAPGNVVAFVNGQRFGGNPRDIQLLDHEVIQLDVGTPVVPFRPMTFKVTGSCATSCSAPAGS